MANAHAKVTKVHFEIKDDISICNLFYESDEPGTPWGGGWKTKSFPKEVSIVDFMNKEVADFIMWPDGKQEDES